MESYVGNIEEISIENRFFRQVLFTGPHCQLVVMSLNPGEDIGLETHGDVDQFFRVETGRGKAILNGREFALADGSALVVSAGTEHNIINVSSSEPLKLYTIYAPPQHPNGAIHRTKADAMEPETALAH